MNSSRYVKRYQNDKCMAAFTFIPDNFNTQREGITTLKIYQN